MPRPSDQLPADATSLARRLAALEREVRELRAARRLESAAIGGGGLTVQATDTGPRIRLTPSGEVTVGDGSNPPAVEFHSGQNGELMPGELAGYLTDTGNGFIPAIDLVTPELGYGVSDLYLAGGGSDGEPPLAILYAGASRIEVQSGAVVLYFGDSATGFTFDSSGGYPTGQTWATLPLNSSWTAYGTPFQPPIYRKQLDGTVQLSGLIAPGTTTAGTAVATLPAGYRPAADHIFRVSAGNASAVADLYVRAATGILNIQNTAGTVAWLSLSNIRFPV